MTDLSDLEIAWSGGNNYKIWSGPDPDGDSEASNAYNVNLSGKHATCTCKHGQMNETSTESCKHIQKAILVADAQVDMERAAFQGLVELWSDAHDIMEDARGARDVLQASQTAQEAAQTDASTADSSTPDDDGDVIVDGPEESSEETEAREVLWSWFVEAAGFNGFDASIIALSVKTVADHADQLAGERVIEVERQPFSGGYYDDGEWQDKEGFDEQKEAVGDSILSPRDEFHWFGEPDYSYVIRVDDVGELVD